MIENVETTVSWMAKSLQRLYICTKETQISRKSFITSKIIVNMLLIIYFTSKRIYYSQYKMGHNITDKTSKHFEVVALRNNFIKFFSKTGSRYRKTKLRKTIVLTQWSFLHGRKYMYMSESNNSDIKNKEEQTIITR